jgi:hypothetical protein
MSDSVWLNVNSGCLTNWQCSMNVNELLNVNTNSSHSAKFFVQDVIFWTTMFIWTIVTVSLVVSWLMLIFAWWNESMWQNWKNGIKYSIIWLLLVMFSYTIIRLVQYLAMWK